MGVSNLNRVFRINVSLKKERNLAMTRFLVFVSLLIAVSTSYEICRGLGLDTDVCS